MGCDISMHIEVKLNGQWHHYASPQIRRDYNLFSKLAGVRGDVDDAISPPKGLPDDITLVTKLAIDDMDGHSYSWLNAEEIAQLASWCNTKSYSINVSFYNLEMNVLHTWLFDNGFSDWVEDNDFTPKENYPKELEDVRLVFWFDS